MFVVFIICDVDQYFGILHHVQISGALLLKREMKGRLDTYENTLLQYNRMKHCVRYKGLDVVL